MLVNIKLFARKKDLLSLTIWAMKLTIKPRTILAISIENDALVFYCFKGVIYGQQKKNK